MGNELVSDPSTHPAIATDQDGLGVARPAA